MNNGSDSRSPSPPPLPIYSVRETPYSTAFNPIPSDYDTSAPSNPEAAIIIDNGSWQLRAGYSTDKSPRLICPPLTSRYRDRRANRHYLLCGSDVYADANTRSAAKSPFEQDVVVNSEVLENLLDYTFLKLGVTGDGQGGIGKPIVMTEAVCNPGYCRSKVSELLFEAYNAPKVCYGIDALFSYDFNGGKTGLVVSSSSTSSHLIPVIEGKGVMNLATRLNWGGAQSAEFLYKLLQLKYPAFPGKFSSWQAEALMLDHCYVSDDYKAEVEHYLDRPILEEKDRLVQFPFTEVVVQEKTQEELDRIAERKKESGRRLQEQAARMRAEKLEKKESDLEYYHHLKNRLENEELEPKVVKKLLGEVGLKDERALDKIIKDLERSIRRSKAKAEGRATPESSDEEPPTFDLLDIPDADLDPEQLKAKRYQRLLKTNYEARLRNKAEKAQAAQEKAEAEAADAREREEDLTGWLKARYDARTSLIERIAQRKKLKEELGNRKSLASQLRMKSLANLASDGPTASASGSGTVTPRKRRRAGADDDDDNFGANDDDWSIYRQIAPGNAVGAEGDESETEELEKQLAKVDEALRTYDPDFNPNPPSDAWKSSRLHFFAHGPRRYEDTPRMAAQMHINIERVRVPEVVFNPSLAGVDQAGIAEIAREILTSRIEEAWREKCARDVFLTGGMTLFKGFEERTLQELRMGLPAEWELAVRRAENPLLDAWKGAGRWWTNEGGKEGGGKVSFTKEEWEECGGEYLKEHRLGNAR